MSTKSIHFSILLAFFLILGTSAFPQNNDSLIKDSIQYPSVADTKIYLDNLKALMEVRWTKNRTINIVFHGHSVPSGYFHTPVINRVC